MVTGIKGESSRLRAGIDLWYYLENGRKGHKKTPRYGAFL